MPGEPLRCTDADCTGGELCAGWRLPGGASTASLGSAVTFTPPRLRLYHHSAACTTTYCWPSWLGLGHVILTRRYVRIMFIVYTPYSTLNILILPWAKHNKEKPYVHASWVKMLLVSQFCNVTLTLQPTFVYCMYEVNIRISRHPNITQLPASSSGAQAHNMHIVTGKSQVSQPPGQEVNRMGGSIHIPIFQFNWYFIIWPFSFTQI